MIYQHPAITQVKEADDMSVGGLFTSSAIILVLFILLVIVLQGSFY